ncbi:MAG: hypothetical protein FWC66_03225 [Oscillospiraceae bacterium]|nr:hypothetical protein [Oscillospiraceae bacterium]
MALTLRFNNLGNAIRNSDRVAEAMDSYADKLSGRVGARLHLIDGGMSANLTNADYMTSRKIRELSVRSENARALSSRIATLESTAREVDGRVKDMIYANSRNNFNGHASLQSSGIRPFLSALWVGTGSISALGGIIELRTAPMAGTATAIRDWWNSSSGSGLSAFMAMPVATSVIAENLCQGGRISLIAALIFSTLQAVKPRGSLKDEVISRWRNGTASGKDSGMARVFGRN